MCKNADEIEKRRGYVDMSGGDQTLNSYERMERRSYVYGSVCNNEQNADELEEVYEIVKNRNYVYVYVHAGECNWNLSVTWNTETGSVGVLSVSNGCWKSDDDAFHLLDARNGDINYYANAHCITLILQCAPYKHA